MRRSQDGELRQTAELPKPKIESPITEGQAMAEQSKESTLTIRVTPSVKAKAMRRALQEGMSLANYIAWLIERDNRGANQKPKRP